MKTFHKVMKGASEKPWLIIILLVALLLRFWGLTTQSFWLDECYTALIADPSKPWSHLFHYLNCCEYHPPMVYILERVFFSVFGYTEFIARLLPALIGVIGVWVMYHLGKEIWDKSGGLLAAAFTCINPFHIWYSQDVRSYIFAFLFSALSFLYFIRFIKYQNRKDAILYGLSTLLLFYSHYFSLFVGVGQFVLAIFFSVSDKINRLAYVRGFLMSGLIVIIGYLPWLPFLLSMSRIDSIWMPPIERSFLQTYIQEYFGGVALLQPIIYLFLLLYFLKLTNLPKIQIPSIKENRWLLSFGIIMIWASACYLLPYWRSVLVVPMLLSRYTIVVLPAILLLLAIGALQIHNVHARNLLLLLFMIISLFDFVFVNRHYWDVKKTQFREMTAFISEPAAQYPILVKETDFPYLFYLRQFNNNAEVLSGDQYAMVDSIIQRTSSKYELDNFWLVGAHGIKPPDENQKRKLKKHFFLLKERNFYDAWAQLYSSTEEVVFVDHTYFEKEKTMVLDDEMVIPIWGGQVETNPFSLDSGQYQLSILAKGTPLQDVFPHLNIYCNNQLIGDLSVSSSYKLYAIPSLIEQDSSIVIRIEMDNDAIDQKKQEDRNTFIRYLSLKKMD